MFFNLLELVGKLYSDKSGSQIHINGNWFWQSKKDDCCIEHVTGTVLVSSFRMEIIGNRILFILISIC